MKKFSRYFLMCILFTVMLSVTACNYRLASDSKTKGTDKQNNTNDMSEEGDSQNTSAEDTPRKQLGELANTGLDNGYSENNDIINGDPHFGWEIGHFFINGYTREVASDDGLSPVFLKNVGDTVSLWFNLEQDIDCLNDDENLFVSDDKDGYNQKHGITKSVEGFGRGTLIISFTDYEGVTHAPVIYTDFLEAKAVRDSDIRVDLFEEGDYEVVLNYELEDRNSIINEVSNTIINSDIVGRFFNYQISFSFKIRNGNCMVYPFDVETGIELSNYSITESGFMLDMANSRYLTIDVEKRVLKEGKSGKMVEDVRFNRPASDGEIYDEEGIYEFTVTNLYTGATTTKIIYVGDDDELKEMSADNQSNHENGANMDTFTEESADDSGSGIPGIIIKVIIVIGVLVVIVVGAIHLYDYT